MRPRRLLKFPKSYCFAVSPKQNCVAALGRNVVLADPQQRTRIGSVHPLPHPSRADFSRDGSRLVVRNTAGFLALLRASDGEFLAGYAGEYLGEGPGTLFSACDRFLVEATWGGGIRVRDAGTLQVLALFPFPSDMMIAISADHERRTWLFAHNPLQHPGMRLCPPYLTLWRWPLRMPVVVPLPANFGHIDDAQLSPCGNYIALHGTYRDSWRNRELLLLRIDGSLLRAIPSPIGGTGGSLRWSSDGRLLAATVPVGYAVYEAATLTCVATFPLVYPSDLAFLGDGTILLGGWESGHQVALPIDGQALGTLDAL